MQEHGRSKPPPLARAQDESCGSRAEGHERRRRDLRDVCADRHSRDYFCRSGRFRLRTASAQDGSLAPRHEAQAVREAADRCIGREQRESAHDVNECPPHSQKCTNVPGGVALNAWLDSACFLTCGFIMARVFEAQ